MPMISGRKQSDKLLSFCFGVMSPVNLISNGSSKCHERLQGRRVIIACGFEFELCEVRHPKPVRKVVQGFYACAAPFCFGGCILGSFRCVPWDSMM